MAYLWSKGLIGMNEPRAFEGIFGTCFEGQAVGYKPK